VADASAQVFQPGITTPVGERLIVYFADKSGVGASVRGPVQPECHLKCSKYNKKKSPYPKFQAFHLNIFHKSKRIKLCVQKGKEKMPVQIAANFTNFSRPSSLNKRYKIRGNSVPVRWSSVQKFRQKF
jgi:hypothetical protein